jgi:tetratricopeptide (TPR) repeat protein
VWPNRKPPSLPPSLAKGRADESAKEFNQSIDLYSEAIALNPKDSTLWNNRGMSKSRMEEHGAAIADASMSSSA